MIGEFSSSDLLGLLEKGEISAGDTCYLEDTSTWQSVEDYIRSTALPKARVASEELIAEPAETRSGRPVITGSLGLIVLGVALLFALALLAAAGAWLHDIQGQLNAAEAKVVELQKELLKRPKSGESAQETPQIPAERTRVVGQVAVRNEIGQKKPLPGFYVDLHEEKTIRDYLLSRSLDLAAFKQSHDPDIMNRVLREMPAPLLKTTTDSAGHFQFRLPAEGRYVAYSSMSVSGPDGPDIVLWFLSFATDDPLNLPVNISEENRAMRMEPEFLIQPGRPGTTSAQ